MTVQDIFNLRRQGKVEEAYQAIIPLYKQHKGHYTTLCMFYTALDILRIRLNQKRVQEAANIYASLCNTYPAIEDKDHIAAVALTTEGMKLSKAITDNRNNSELRYPYKFIDFMCAYGKYALSENDYIAPNNTKHPIPSRANQIATRMFHEAIYTKDSDFARKTLPFVEVCLSNTPYNYRLLRAKAALLVLMGKKEEAKPIYQRLVPYTKDSYIFTEYAALVDDVAEEVGLYCMAILTKKNETFAQKARLNLAELLADVRPHYAKYELNKIENTRTKMGIHPTKPIIILQQKLKKIQPANDKEQMEFYLQMKNYLQEKYTKNKH